LKLNELIVSEFKRRVFDESYLRIFKCLNQLNENQIWYAPNNNTNSIGNLILHLEGNLRQWMCTSFGKANDFRKRSEEFNKKQSESKKALELRLTKVKEEILLFIDTISENDLTKIYQVQVYQESGASILIHVIEHFSYHTGQIAYITKLLDDKDLNFYPESLE
jgi:uncharacterized damage-inducible protein DinB